jgi:prevent-host-death family protein
MPTVTIEEAQAKLSEIIAQLAPGQELTITRDDQPVAKLIGAAPPPRQPRQPGSARGMILFMAEDFDAPLEDFEDDRG